MKWSEPLFCLYTKKNCFTIRINHDSFQCIVSIADFIKRLARWRLKLSESDIDVIDCTGIRHQACDALLQLDTFGKAASAPEDDLPMYAIDKIDKPLVSVHTVAHEKNRTQKAPNNKLSDLKTTYNSPTAAKKYESSSRIPSAVELLPKQGNEIVRLQ